MKRIAIILCMTIGFAYLNAEEISVSRLPQSAEDFVAMRTALATTPEGGAAMLMVAFITYVENQKLGKIFFTLALDQSKLVAGNTYKGFSPDSSIQYHLDRFAVPERKRAPYSYIAGTTPANNYKASLPFTFSLNRTKYSVQSDGSIKVFIDCSGASSPRPIRMQKNDKGIWKASECSSIFLDVESGEKNSDDL